MKTRAAPAGTTPSRSLNISNDLTQLFIGGNAFGTVSDESVGYIVASPAVSAPKVTMALPGQGHDSLRDNIDHTVAIRIDGVDNAVFVDGVKQSATFIAGNTTTSGFFLNGGGTVAMFIGVEDFQGTIFGGAPFDFSGLDIHDVGLTDLEISQKG